MPPGVSKRVFYHKIVFHYCKNPKNCFFIQHIIQILHILGILEVFWAVLRHIRSPYRPAKGPLIFKNSVLTYTYIFPRRYPEKLGFHWIYSIKFTHFDHFGPLLHSFRHMNELDINPRSSQTDLKYTPENFQ